MSSYKKQQYRWAKGSLQAMRLLVVPLLRAPFTWRQKVDALLFLTGNIVHLLLILILLLRLPLLIWPTVAATRLDMLLTVWVVGMAVPPLYGWAKGQRSSPLDSILQCGIAPTGAYGALVGLWGPLGGEFERTLKVGSVGPGALDKPSQRVYDVSIFGEFVLFGAALVAVVLAVWRAQWFALPILLFHVLGLGWVSVLQIAEVRFRR
jgi:hypothetical protein